METNIPFRMHSRIKLSEFPKSIHLLPPHEHISSVSLTGHSFDGRIHTRFAWLGHGTIMHRELSESFLSLIDDLNLSDEERKMSDNYFTILRNDFTEIWHHQGIELGGGQPFTVGTEGEQRNVLHIVSAFYLFVPISLETIQGRGLGYLDKFLDSAGGHSYVLQDARGGPPWDTIQAVCLKRPCLLSVSLPGSSRYHPHRVGVAKDLLSMASSPVGSLEHALSHAVDADPRTYFKSKQGIALAQTSFRTLAEDN